MIGQWAGRNNFPIFYHTPSLAEHIGHSSTLVDDLPSVENARKSLDFVGEDTDISDWLNEPVSCKRHAKLLMC